ncbi:Protein YicC [hydrothermal vent metagenome]|uniref:Protein YicC n=1 Tax=hydrothermal vent metagenome TaxID=652676 RepID=A0A3B0TIF7_9ZZZZ
MTQRLASMTGYARSTNSDAGSNFQVEIKSVNARGLDIRLRMTPGLDALEPHVRRILGERLKRGAINCAISLQRDNAQGEVVINEQALGAVLDALDKLAGKIEADRPRLDGILAIKGVLETREAPLSTEGEQRLHQQILAALDYTLDELIEARHQEGGRLAAIISEQVDEIENLTQKAHAHPLRRREVFVERIRNQIAQLSEAESGLSEERLYQEALILATKADIREELDRLFSHIESARQLIANGGPVGRKLDFLAQEFNREANTLCSKAHAVELSAIGLDLKAVIDQLREQVQNIE